MRQVLSQQKFLFCLFNKLANWGRYYNICRSLNINDISQLLDYLKNNKILMLDLLKARKMIKDIYQDYFWQKKEHSYIVSYDSQLYPPLLRFIYNPPAILYVLGNINCLTSSSVAIVGSRKTSPSGIDSAKYFASNLSDYGLIVISGLAMGTDIACHLSCIAGGYASIAVMPAGLEHITPKLHLRVAEQIIKNGALISEVAPFVSPKPYHFPQRNRLISGISLGVLVVEAEYPSGTTITARHALEQNRSVMVVPGAINNPLAAGCLQLIKQGACCITGVNDVLAELGLPNSGAINSLICSNNIVLNSIDFAATPVAKVLQRTKMSVDAVTQELVKLNLSGHIQPWRGGWVRVR